MRPARRTACRALAGGLVAAAALPVVGGAGPGNWPQHSGFAGIDQRHLRIRQAGRAETAHVAFRTGDGALDWVGVRRLSWLFRDWRDGDQAIFINVRLFDLLATVQTTLSILEAQPIELRLTSGYRTARRNRSLEGAAVHSQHVWGRAADITAPGSTLAKIREAAEIAGAPGLGTYASFVHLDVGPAGRRWSG